MVLIGRRSDGVSKEKQTKQAINLIKRELVAAKLEDSERKRTGASTLFDRTRALSDADSALLNAQIPVIGGQLVQSNLQFMVAFRALVTVESVPPKFSEDPVGYVEKVTDGAIMGGEVAPGVKLDPEALTGMLEEARLKYHGGQIDLPDELMAVHTDTSTRSYVQSERRTSFTFEKSNITGTEKRSIMSSETRTTTVTSGRDLLDLDLSNILIRPEVLDERLARFLETFDDAQPNLNELLDPMLDRAVGPAASDD